MPNGSLTTDFGYNITSAGKINTLTELFDYNNLATDNLFSILTIFAIWIIIFVKMNGYTRRASVASATASFVTTTGCVVLNAGNLLPQNITIISFAVLLFSVMWVYTIRRESV